MVCIRELLLLLSHFSHSRLCATPWTAAHQAPLSLGFSRQGHWSGLPFPSPMHESEVAQPCLTHSDPMDCSLPGSSVHGIFQARVLEWGAIAFSGQRVKKAYKLMHKERKRIKDDIAVEDQRGEHLPLSVWYLSKANGQVPELWTLW